MTAPRFDRSKLTSTLVYYLVLVVVFRTEGAIFAKYKSNDTRYRIINIVGCSLNFSPGNSVFFNRFRAWLHVNKTFAKHLQKCFSVLFYM